MPKPNPYKKKPHELNEMERLKQKAAKALTLEQTVKELNKEQKYLHREIDALRNGLSESSLMVAKFRWLLEQEVMLMTPEGVKYLKGEDLDKYVEDSLTPVALDLSKAALEDVMARMQKGLTRSMVQEFIVDDASDAYTYSIQGKMIWR